MDDYSIGKDIQLIVGRLASIEAKIDLLFSKLDFQPLITTEESGGGIEPMAACGGGMGACGRLVKCKD